MSNLNYRNQTEETVMLYLDGTKLIAIQNAPSKIDLPQFKFKNSGEQKI